MSSPTSMGNDDQLDTPRRLSGRTWVVIFFIAALFIDFAATKTVASLLFQNKDDTLVCVLAGFLAAQFAGTVVVTGLAGSNWIRGQVLAMSAACLIALFVRVGTGFTQYFWAYPFSWSDIATLPWFVLVASVPLAIARLLGWRLIDSNAESESRQPSKLADLFQLVAFIAATLTIARLPQVVHERDASDFWVPFLGNSGLVILASGVMLPAATYLFFGAVHRTRRLLLIALLALCCYAATFLLYQQVLTFDQFVMGREGDWPTPLEILRQVGISVSTFLCVFYPACFILARSGVRFDRVNGTPTGGHGDVCSSSPAKGHAFAWIVRHAELLVIGAIAMGASIYSARLDYWRKTQDRDIERLVTLAESLGGDILAIDREIKYITLGHGTTDLHVEDFVRHQALVHVDIESSRVTDRSLERLSQMSELQYLRLRKASITDKELNALAKLKKLNTLDLSDTPVNGSGLSVLNRSCPIQRLVLKGTNVSDATIPSINGFTSLLALSLSGTAITDKGLLQVSPGLLWLINLDGTAISGRGLKNLKHIGILSVGDCPAITDESLKVIAELDSIELLNLRNTAVTDIGVQHLRRLPKLQYLRLSSTKISDAGISQLDQFPGLQTVELNHTKVTGEAFASWKASEIGVLSLIGTPISDDVLPALARLKLQQVHLGQTQVTAEGILAAGFSGTVVLVAPGQFSPAERQHIERVGIYLEEHDHSSLWPES